MPRPSLRSLFSLSLALGLAALAACQNKGHKWDNPRDETAFHPANLTCGGTRPTPSGKTSDKDKDLEQEGYLMDAMIGQVNGKALYAEQILKPLEPTLKRLGRTETSPDFKLQARTLIGSELRGFISRAQILSKAEGHLKDNQRAGLNGLVEKHREELLRQYGEGSTALAEANILKEKEHSLAEELKNYREEQVIGYYMYEKVFPLVNVTRRDIERYYNDHLADYNKAETRQVRLIHVSTLTPLAGSQVAAALAGGQAFEKVAADPALNTFSPAKSGAFASPIIGKPALAMAELNDAIAGLKTENAWAGPIKSADGTIWFVGLAAYVPGTNRSLDDAQLEIRNTLSGAQRAMLSDKIYAKAAEDVSISDPQKMLVTLLLIAQARYAAK